MNDYKPQTMLVTGGAGFIGSNFIRFMLNADPAITIVNLDKLTYAGSLDNLTALPHSNRHHFIQGDIKDKMLVSHLMQHHHIDTIVHFAAESHVDRSIEAPADFIETNIQGTFVLLEAARHYWMETKKCDPGHCRFHHISTDEVYGSLNHDDPPFTEQSPYQPRSPYSASKAGSDHLVNAYYHTYHVPITLSRCTNNYGPYQHNEKFIPTIVNACIAQTRIPVYGDGKNSRDWLYVEDHCRGILSVIQQGQLGESYNMAGMNEWENLNLAEYICEQMDQLFPENAPHAKLIDFIKDRPGHDFRYAMSIAKIKNALDWTPQENMDSGIKKTIAFYIHNKASLKQETA